MRKGLRIALAAIASWLALPAAAEARCPDSKLTAQPRPVSGFREIGLSVPGQLIVKQGPRESLVVRAESSVLAHVQTDVRSGRLELELDDHHNHQIDCGIVFEVTVVNLSALSVSGAGKVSVAGLTGKQLSLELSGAAEVSMDRLALGELAVSMSGAAKVTATGKATRQRVNISGTGQYKGEQLSGQNVTVEVSGAGKAQVNAARELSASISGIGNVDYVGNPRVHQEISGVGRVRPLKR